MNSFRIALVALLVDRWGTSQAEGLLHFFEGWVIFIACTVLLTGEVWLLTLISGKAFSQVFHLPKVHASHESGPSIARFKPVIAVISLALICLAGASSFYLLGRQEYIPDRQRFVSFPRTIGSWQGKPTSMEPQVEHFLNLDDYILSDYQKRNTPAVNFYVAYYASQRKGSSPHSPVVCIPGDGWQITSFERTTYRTASGSPLPLNRAVIVRGKDKQLVYYWFVQRGRNIASEYSSKWYLFVDAILHNRTDGALVRLVTPFEPGESEIAADERLRAFIDEVKPALQSYLPSSLHADLITAVPAPAWPVSAQPAT